MIDASYKLWERHSPKCNQKWPKARGSHVANCLVDPESNEAKQDQWVIVFWGQGADGKCLHIPDIWVLHVQSIMWKEVYALFVIPAVHAVYLFLLVVSSISWFSIDTKDIFFKL